MTWLSERALAARWSVSKTTIQRLRGSGRLPHMRVGDVIRYRISDIERFEADHYNDAVVIGLRRSPTQRRSQAPSTNLRGASRVEATSSREPAGPSLGDAKWK